MSKAAPASTLNEPAQISRPCEGRGFIFELASFIILAVSIILLLVAMWPDRDLADNLRSFFQREGYTRSLNNDVKQIIFILIFSTIATGVYLIRLILSLFSFDSIGKYCVDILKVMPTEVALLEWFIRLLIVLYLLMGISRGFFGFDFLIFFPIYPDILAHGAANNGNTEFQKIAETINAINFISVALLGLITWSLLTSYWVIKNSNCMDWLIRFMLGPLVNLLIFYLVLNALQIPEKVTTTPTSTFPIYAAVIFQLVYSLGGILGLKVEGKIWPPQMNTDIKFKSGLLSQAIIVWKNNSRRTFMSKSKCQAEG